MWLGFSLLKTYDVIEFVSIKLCKKRVEHKRQKLIESKLSDYDLHNYDQHFNHIKQSRRKHKNINNWHQIKPKVSNIWTENLSHIN